MNYVHILPSVVFSIFAISSKVSHQKSNAITQNTLLKDKTIGSGYVSIVKYYYTLHVLARVDRKHSQDSVSGCAQQNPGGQTYFGIKFSIGFAIFLGGAAILPRGGVRVRIRVGIYIYTCRVQLPVMRVFLHVGIQSYTFLKSAEHKF